MVNYLHLLIPIIGLLLNVGGQIVMCRYRLLHVTLLKSIVLGFVLGLAGVITLEIGIRDMTSASMGEWFATGCVNLLIYAALGYCYFHFINLGETARRIRLLRELYEAGNGLTLDEMLARYNANHVVEMRLGRLLHNGQIIERQGTYFIGSPVMLFVARSMMMMKYIVLGKKSEFE